MKSTLLWLTWTTVVPLVSYVWLLQWIASSGAATVMLGAVSGSGTLAIAAMMTAQALRLYLVVILPPLWTYQAVRRLMHVGLGRRPPPGYSSDFERR